MLTRQMLLSSFSTGEVKPMLLRNFFILFALATFTACAHTNIAGTQIPDTPQNREIAAVVKKALNALTQRDADTVLSLVSPQYFEDNGTPQPDDDYGYEQLKQLLPQTLKAAKEVFIDADLQSIEIINGRAQADLRYRSRANLELPAGPLWDSHREFNRIELIFENNTWKIISGL
ncbi:MAG: hypothetical protein JW841_16170 [Deltaproteobacteria bacterium]|nr:hypothetical protein [Deltaproteobacteria bacterium]